MTKREAEVRAMELTSFSQWCAWQSEYHHLPYIIGFELTGSSLLNERANLLSWEPVWRQAQSRDAAFVLESGKMGQYTYIGLQPQESISGFYADTLQPLRIWLQKYRSPRVEGAPCFFGGAVGYLAYDMARCIERLPSQAVRDIPIPDYRFDRYDELWIVDHEAMKLYCAVTSWLGESKLLSEAQLLALYQQAQLSAKRMKYDWDRWSEEAYRSGEKRVKSFSGAVKQAYSTEPIRTSLTKKQFVDAVHAVHNYIRAGDVFQVNLSVRQSRPLRTSSTDIYEWLRLLNPSPYMGFLKYPAFDLVSASPELLVKLDNRTLTTRPIAGTRPRGTTQNDDSELAAELLLSDKERAEHIMLVDLERNDLGRVSRLGSVRVEEMMTIERYSHVMHIVSQIEGELRAGLDAFDAIAAVFPGGTITGAPKIRTMEIIEELEPVRRGVYTGALGWIGYHGDMELNIIIRTMLVYDGWAHVQAGAGIVIDSVAEREYEESLNKAKALWTAVQLSEHHTKSVQKGRS